MPIPANENSTTGARQADGSGDTPVLYLFLGARQANGSGDAPVLFLFLGARQADGSGDTPVLFLFLGARRADGSGDTPVLFLCGPRVYTSGQRAPARNTSLPTSKLWGVSKSPVPRRPN